MKRNFLVTLSALLTESVASARHPK